MKELKGTFKYEQDSKNFHRYKIKADEDITGTFYVPKDNEKMPARIILERQRDAHTGNEQIKDAD